MNTLNECIEYAYRLRHGELDDGSEPSPELLALLKLTATFPWLIDVADYGYDPEMAEAILLFNAADIYMKKRIDGLLTGDLDDFMEKTNQRRLFNDSNKKNA